MNNISLNIEKIENGYIIGFSSYPNDPHGYDNVTGVFVRKFAATPAEVSTIVAELLS